jgi:orotate phosphoribosyltransferase
MSTVANDVARILFKLNCVQLKPSEPFTYASGLKGPIYCDNRQILSYVAEREVIINYFVELINSLNLDYDCLAGLATAGIPHAAWIADKLKKPMIYIRGKAKGHGKQNQVEGAYTKGQKVLFVEDLVNQGKSLGDAYDGAINAGLNPVGCVSIVDYEMQNAKDRLETLSLKLYSLANFSDLITYAQDSELITEKDHTLLVSWQNDPVRWSQENS